MIAWITGRAPFKTMARAVDRFLRQKAAGVVAKVCGKKMNK